MRFLSFVVVSGFFDATLGLARFREDFLPFVSRSQLLER